MLCLFSALSFYHIGTQNPCGVWIMVKSNSHVPKVNFPLECIRCSDAVYDFGIEERVLNNLPIKVYSPAKTVADCFKFRNRYGLDLALEALRDGWRRHKFTVDELNQDARIDRVQNVMTPYMEMMINEP